MHGSLLCAANLTAEHESFRREICNFLQAELNDDAWTDHRDPSTFQGWSQGFTDQFRAQLGGRGFIGVDWPREYGGQERGILFHLILVSELQRHAAPGSLSADLHAPYLLMSEATPQTKGEVLPRVLAGDASIFLGYSEPEAGSDLANIQTKAEETHSGFTLSGHKTYATDAERAEYGLVAARTAQPERRYDGISLFLVDMSLTGIELTQSQTIGGWQHPDVYFNQVELPHHSLVGSLHEGFKALMRSIDFERIVNGAPGYVERQVNRLARQVIESRSASEKPSVVDDIVTLAIDATAAREYALAAGASLRGGFAMPAEATLCQLLKREAARSADWLSLDIFGPLATVRGLSDGAPNRGEVEQDLRDNVYFQFAAGGFDVTRNVIARRGLNLPRI
jgi:3-oxocholest-4-en-26-oyl-CoA dehydrogenase alpha subunit